jgi:hypothetical protein
VAQFSFLLPLLVSPSVPLPFPFNYLESHLLHGAIPSTLAPGSSQTDLPFPISSPFPPYSKFLTARGFPKLIVRLTKATSQSRLPWSGTVCTYYNLYIVHFRIFCLGHDMGSPIECRIGDFHPTPYIGVHPIF